MRSVILIVLDGLGLAPPGPGNVFTLANARNLNSYLFSYPHTELSASGESVGLPTGEVGNTEVGHINLGAGRIVYQNLPRIDLSIADGTFYKNEAFLGVNEHINSTGGALHLIGLVGSGTVHASLEHLYALLFFCKENQLKKVFLHIITDGRDSPPQAAKNYIKDIKDRLDHLGLGEIATVMGRYYAMDRDRRWERIEKAYLCLTKGVGDRADNWEQAVDNSYLHGKTDEFIPPTNITRDGTPVATINDGDAVIFFNYRIDRPRELTKAFVLDNFEADANKTDYDPFATKYFQKHEVDEPFNKPFSRPDKINNLYFVTLTEYEKALPVQVAFPRHVVKMPLGRVLNDHQIYQLRVSESEKERFVTYYFNGAREEPFELEDRLIVPSKKVATYDLMPEMSAYEITDVLIRKIYENKYQFILVNFANPDMIGHTGNIQAGVIAIQTLDKHLGTVVSAALRQDMVVLITADHGNIEEMINIKTGQMSTEHTSNPVPFIAIAPEFANKPIKLKTGILADVAPTILAIMGIEKPQDMTGRNLLEELKV